MNIKEIRHYSLSLPNVTEDVKWDTLANTPLIDREEIEDLIQGSYLLIRDKKKKS